MGDYREHELVERFQCRGPDGAAYFIIAFQHYLVPETLDDAPPQRLALQREYRTTDGRAVNRLSDNEFELLDPILGEVRLHRAIPL